MKSRREEMSEEKVTNIRPKYTPGDFCEHCCSNFCYCTVESLKNELFNKLNLIKNRNQENAKLREALDVAKKYINRWGMLQMGKLDYTEDFFEIIKTETRESLDKLNAILSSAEKKGEK